LLNGIFGVLKIKGGIFILNMNKIRVKELAQSSERLSLIGFTEGIILVKSANGGRGHYTCPEIIILT
jgi:hypothetical protein